MEGKSSCVQLTGVKRPTPRSIKSIDSIISVTSGYGMQSMQLNIRVYSENNSEAINKNSKIY